ncbi:hypothetical protein BaRGS_00029045, partial [Batillaria attramentaria]
MASSSPPTTIKQAHGKHHLPKSPQMDEETSEQNSAAWARDWESMIYVHYQRVHQTCKDFWCQGQTLPQSAGKP